MIPRLSRNIKIICNVSTALEPLDPLIRLQVMDRRKNKYEFIGNEDDLVIKGAKFSFNKTTNFMSITAKGPTLAELIISVSFYFLLLLFYYPFSTFVTFR